MAEPRNRYSTVSLVLHWGIAALVVAQVLLISAHEAFDNEETRQFINLHKSVGLSILILTLGRIGWRVANPAIPLPEAMPRWQKLVARATHVLFYVLLLAMPLVGWTAMSAFGSPIDWFGLFDWPLLPMAQDRALGRALMDVHELAAKLLYVLIFLHVAGALKHHFVDRDNVLHRMLPFIPRRP